jgi:pyruvate/2-oxoglutarate dehydrogenase complex dihydrolipoamide acyltransferase (E2) component
MDEMKTNASAAEHFNGRTAALGSDRAIVMDVVRLARQIPAFPVERWFDVAEVAEARSAASTRISWVALFAKAYALACKDVPQLRRFYISFPWPRFFQSRYCVISVAINRTYQGSDRLFFGRLRWPEDKSLVEIQRELDGYVKGEVDEMFRQQLLSSRVPRWIRSFGWWWRTNVRPSQRARRLGTGSISVLAGQGVFNRQHPCLLTSSLSYGPLQEDGRLWVTLQCDHRLVDGFQAAQAINLMSDYLGGQILSELRELRNSSAAA